MLDVLVYLAGHLGRLGAVLLGVGEDRAVVELGLLDEADELVELLGRLAGEAHERRRAQRDAGHLAAQAGDHLEELLRVARAVHVLEDLGVAVLKRDVDVLHDLGRVADGGNELVGQALGLQVQDAHPAVVGTHLLGHLAQQVSKRGRAGQVAAPDARVLADEDDLAHAALKQVAHLGEDDVLGAREVTPADVGNRAERAEAVAAVRDLHVGEGRLDGAGEVRHGLGGVLDAQDVAKHVADLVLAVARDEGSHVGHLPLNLVAVARGDAAGHDDRAGDAALKLLGHQGQRQLDALFHGAHQEGAGVDDDDVGSVRVIDDGQGRIGFDEGAHAVGIDLVLGASQGDEGDVMGLVLHRMKAFRPLETSGSW